MHLQPQHRYQQHHCTMSLQQERTNQLTTQSQTNQSRIHIAYTAGQRPKACRCHLYFATSCKPWIQWPEDKRPRTLSQRSKKISRTTSGGNLCIRRVAKLGHDSEDFIADTGSGKSILKTNLLKTNFVSPTVKKT